MSFYVPGEKLWTIVCGSLTKTRNSRLEVFCKKKCFEIFCKTNRESTSAGDFFDKVSGLPPKVSLKNTSTWVFFRELCQIFQNSYFVKHVRVLASAGS